MQCLYALSLHLGVVVFGTTIPTSLYIFGKCFIYLLVSFFCCTIVHHIGGCSSSALPSGYMNSVDWSGWTGLLEWTTGLEHWSTGTLEPSSVTAGYALYPCITQLRQTLDSVSTWQKHGELAVITFRAWPIILHMLNTGTNDAGTTTRSSTGEKCTLYQSWQS